MVVDKGQNPARVTVKVLKENERQFTYFKYDRACLFDSLELKHACLCCADQPGSIFNTCIEFKHTHLNMSCDPYLPQ